MSETPWFKFSKDFDYRPHNRAVIAYKKDMHLRIPKAHAEAAIAAQAGEYTDHEPKAGDATDGTQEIRSKGAKTVSVPQTKG